MININPLISICITSYNRLITLERCLMSIKSNYPNKIEIVISEDCSPDKFRITEMVEKFKKNSIYNVIYNCNSVNLGFDKNFRKLIDISNGTYLVFVTDDDAIIETSIDNLIDSISELSDFSVAFTPYLNLSSNSYERKYSNTNLLLAGMPTVINYLYSSILLSGLIFKKSKIPDYNSELFKDLIYSQVYVFASILKQNDGYYINIPLINYIGDGENAFGKNDGLEKNELLADRSNYLSNLEFHKNLIKTIKLFDLHYNENLIIPFSKEYSLKSYTGMSYARKNGKKALDEFWEKINQLDIKLLKITFLYYFSLRIFGYRLTNVMISPFKIALLKIRSRF